MKHRFFAATPSHLAARRMRRYERRHAWTLGAWTAAVISLCACGRLGFESALDGDAANSTGTDARDTKACGGLPNATALSTTGGAVDAIAVHAVANGYVVLWLEQVRGGAEHELRGALLDMLGQPAPGTMPGGKLLVPADAYVDTFGSSVADDSGALTVAMQRTDVGGTIDFYRYDVGQDLEAGGTSELSSSPLLLTDARNQVNSRGNNIMIAGKDMMDDVSVLTISSTGTVLRNAPLAPEAKTESVTLERLPSGGALAAWSETNADGTFQCKLIRLDSDGQPLDATPREVASSACNQGTGIATDPNDAVAVVWQQQVGATGAAIRFQSFTASLTDSTSALMTPFENLASATPAVRVEWHEAESGYRALWIEDTKIMTRLVMPDGTPESSKQPFISRSNPIRTIATAHRDGEVAVAWYESTAGVFFTNTCLAPGL